MENYLSHHGIKGQKWGVRRFQNKDGSLTSAGKRRADKLRDKANMERTYAEDRNPAGYKVKLSDKERAREQAAYNKHMAKAKEYDDKADAIEKAKIQKKAAKMRRREIMDAFDEEQEKVYNEVYSKSRSKSYNDAADNLKKFYDLEEDGSGGIPGTPSLARDQYKYFRKQANRTFEEDKILEQVQAKTRENVVKKYGSKSVEELEAYELKAGLVATGALLALGGAISLEQYLRH